MYIVYDSPCPFFTAHPTTNVVTELGKDSCLWFLDIPLHRLENTQVEK